MLARLEIDLINQKPTLIWAKSELEIDDAFVRLKQKLHLAVVPTGCSSISRPRDPSPAVSA